MAEIVNIAISKLLLDTKNARLKDEQPNQQVAILAIAKEEGRKLLKLANDIVEHGLDPISLLAVVPADGQHEQYKVVEGNRRVAALKALETPALVGSAYTNAEQQKWAGLTARFGQNPHNNVSCIVFQSEDDANYWVKLRHTGANEGVGLSTWGSDEIDRYNARHGQRSPAGQIIDFVRQQGLLSEEAKTSDTKIITTLERLISTPQVRKELGINIEDKKVVMLYPSTEVAKSLTRVVEDLATEKINVKDVYHANDRIKYIASLTADALPNPNMRLPLPVPLGEAVTTPKQPKPKPLPPNPKPLTDRPTLIPKNCRFSIPVSASRIRKIYDELCKLEVDQFPNHCSVILRVFVELSVEHYLVDKKIRAEKQLANHVSLQHKMKEAGNHLEQNGIISPQLNKVVTNIADGQGVLAASVLEMHLYIHNQYIFPKATELKTAWDELQPFMEALWK